MNQMIAVPVAAASASVPFTASASEGPDPAFALIAEKKALDVAHCAAVVAQDEAEERYGRRSEAAVAAAEVCGAMCDTANKNAWQLATVHPTSLAGIAAVLRFANKVEDEGGDWPETDTIGPEGWHYQLRKTMAEAIEAILAADQAA